MKKARSTLAQDLEEKRQCRLGLPEASGFRGSRAGGFVCRQQLTTASITRGPRPP